MFKSFLWWFVAPDATSASSIRRNCSFLSKLSAWSSSLKAVALYQSSQSKQYLDFSKSQHPDSICRRNSLPASGPPRTTFTPSATDAMSIGTTLSTAVVSKNTHRPRIAGTGFSASFRSNFSSDSPSCAYERLKDMSKALVTYLRPYRSFLCVNARNKAVLDMISVPFSGSVSKSVPRND